MVKRYIPRTKIVCTLGPASSSETVLRKMIMAGMDIARINFSHGNKAGHSAHISLARTINRKYRRSIKLLGDLAGPRVRMGYFKNRKPFMLEKNKVLYLVREGDQAARSLPFDYQGEFTDIAGAKNLYLDDGNIILKVIDISSDRIKTRVVVGGLLKERKAINFPGAKLKFPPLSDKDKKDIDFAVEAGLDYLALSFVRSRKDVEVVREYIGRRLPKCKIISKIENRAGIRNIDEIIEISDGIMVARGDMGVCVPIYEVPIIQKKIIKKCRAKRKPVITATQMLESMVSRITPTRAEVTDVANAVLDGTTSVMLSAETAVGRYPAETVDMMNKIIRHTELNS
ncbi:pyruvate kinase [Verrucomicrobiota bacterium]